MIADEKRREVTKELRDQAEAWRNIMPGIPRIRYTDAEGHVYEGYYFFRVKRQLCPLGHDRLRPEDCRHCIAMDEPADWNMERPIGLAAIDPDGGTIEILEGE